MRAHYKKDLEISDEYELSGEVLHHLVNVIRIESGEDLLLLNGQGLVVQTKVQKVSKKVLRLIKVVHSYQERLYDFNLALGMPKRDALDLCLKEATELGFKTIYLIRSDRSQMKFPESARLEKLLVSALEQSNAPWLPQIICTDWGQLPWSKVGHSLLLDSQTPTDSFLIAPNGSCLLIVGPEGGFSDQELKLFRSQQSLQAVNLPTPILRTPTALAVGTGMMIQSLRKC
jgi:16S rRNA (uracil1498-N3)-methyltransferase